MYKGFFLTKGIADKAIDIISKSLQKKKLNIGLLFDKYVIWWNEKGELKCGLEMQISMLRDPQKTKSLLTDRDIRDKKFRDKMTENVRFSIPLIFFPSDGNKEYWKIYTDRMYMLFDTLRNMGFHLKYLPNKNTGLPVKWRLIINLGAASVYETSLLFHRNYSFPYIPGSAVKGVTRHWTIQKFAEEIKKLGNKKYEDATKEVNIALENGRNLGIELNNITFKDVIKIFGTQNKKGEVIFFDALPVVEQDKDFVVLDVMNVHYRPYYEKEETPGDWYSPTLIFFLAVEKGTKFRFTLASRNKELVEKAKRLLKEALENLGVGAKTSTGYGYFEV